MPMSSSGTCVVGHLLQLPPAEAGAAERGQPVLVRPGDRPQDVRTVAAPADCDEQVARGGEVLQLLDEDPVEPLVVAPGQDVRGIVGQAEDLESLLGVVVEELAGERPLADVLADVGGVRPAPAVADDEDEPAGGVAVPHQVGELLHLRRVDPPEFGGHAVEELPGVERRAEHRGPSRDQYSWRTLSPGTAANRPGSSVYRGSLWTV